MGIILRWSQKKSQANGGCREAGKAEPISGTAENKPVDCPVFHGQPFEAGSPDGRLVAVQFPEKTPDLILVEDIGQCFAFCRMTLDTYEFSSCFAPYIEGLIQRKHEEGFLFLDELR